MDDSSRSAASGSSSSSSGSAQANAATELLMNPTTSTTSSSGSCGGSGSSSSVIVPMAADELAEWSSATVTRFATRLSAQQQNAFLRKLLSVCNPRTLFELSNAVLSEARYQQEY